MGVYASPLGSVFNSPFSGPTRAGFYSGDSIPPEDLLFLTLGQTESSYLLDISGNENHFTIISGSGPDDWIVAAPAGATALIAADTTNVFYDETETPINVTLADFRRNYDNRIFAGEKIPLAIYDSRQTDAVSLRAESSVGSNNWATDVPQEEADALMKFFFATDGLNWTNSDWLDSDTVNDWYGITVSGGHVTRVTPNGNGSTVHGAGFDYLAPLTYLTIITLAGNNVSGNLSTILNFPNLTNINAQGCTISGDLSVFYSFTTMTYLLLIGNPISGNINALVGNTGLSYLNLGGLTCTYSTDRSVVWSVGNYQLSDVGLDETEIDNILCDLVSGGGINGVLNLSNNAVPSATGLACKDTLVTNGWTVTVAT